MFQDMLVIRSLREDRAARSASRQRSVLGEARCKLEAVQSELESFKAYSRRREASLYRELCSRIVSLRDIEAAQLVVAELRSKEQALDDSRQNAEETVAVEAAQLEVEVQNHAVANRLKQKFVEVVRNHLDAHQIEVERHEDLELEEIAGRLRRPSEWQSDYEEDRS